jgi:hypothetical protein
MNIRNQNFFPNGDLLFQQLYKIQIKSFLRLYQLIKMNKRISDFNYPFGNQRLFFPDENKFMLVLDYRLCAQLLTTSSINDVEHRLIELLNVFNSKTCQLVLGAGAVKLGKIRTISAKILAITCRCLQFIKVTLPKIKSHFDQLQVKLLFVI